MEGLSQRRWGGGSRCALVILELWLNSGGRLQLYRQLRASRRQRGLLTSCSANKTQHVSGAARLYWKIFPLIVFLRGFVHSRDVIALCLTPQIYRRLFLSILMLSLHCSSLITEQNKCKAERSSAGLTDQSAQSSPCTQPLTYEPFKLTKRFELWTGVEQRTHFKCRYQQPVTQGRSLTSNRINVPTGCCPESTGQSGVRRIL